MSLRPHLVVHLFLLIIIIIPHVVHSRSCECGQEPMSTRIIHGRVSTPSQYPWVVYLMNRQLLMSCSGVVVDDRHILTSAHCVTSDQDPSKIFVFLEQGCGRSDLFSGRQLRVRRTSRHPLYVSQTGGNDVAILQLDRRLRFNQTFVPICFPSPASPVSSSDRQPDTYLVSGWGQTSEGLHIVDNDCLNDVELKSVPDWKCRLYYGTNLDTERIMCAGGHENICNGDSGGPLMQRHEGRMFLKGLTSFGRKDCGIVTKQAAAFERVAPHVQWMERNGVDPCFK